MSKKNRRVRVAGWQGALLTALVMHAANAAETAEQQSIPEPSLDAWQQKQKCLSQGRCLMPVGVIGHHRTLCVTRNGAIGDLPMCQSARAGKAVGGVKLLPSMADCVGISVGKRFGPEWGRINAQFEHSRLTGGLPIIVSRGKYGNGLAIEQTVFACLPDGGIESQTGREPLLAFVSIVVEIRGKRRRCRSLTYGVRRRDAESWAG